MPAFADEVYTPPAVLKWPALPYALSVATPRWEIEANGTKSIAYLNVYGGAVGFNSGAVSKMTEPLEIEMALVAIGKYDRMHRITCKTPGAVKAYVRTRNTINGQVVTSPEKIYYLSGKADAKFELDLMILPKLSFLTVVLKSGGFAECAVRVTPNS